MRATILLLATLALAVPLLAGPADVAPVASATPSCWVGHSCYAVFPYTCEPWMPACPEV